MPDDRERRARDGLSVSDAIQTSLADSTRAAYRTGWQRFAGYCEEAERDPMDATPDDVANFLVRVASKPVSQDAKRRSVSPLALGTLRISLAAINRRYREAGRISPASDVKVRDVLRGLRRRSGKHQRQVKALREHDLARILSHCDVLAAHGELGNIATRDAALLSTGFAAALRRSEICGLHRGDLEFVDQGFARSGMLVHIRRSKTDQFGQGHTIPIPDGNLIRPVIRMRRWLSLSGIAGGPAFPTMGRGGRLRGRALHPNDIGRLVKRYVGAIGLDPSEYSGHSLRVGFVTSAAVHGARFDRIMDITRHSSPRTVLRYIREADAFKDHPGTAFL